MTGDGMEEDIRKRLKELHDDNQLLRQKQLDAEYTADQLRKRNAQLEKALEEAHASLIEIKHILGGELGADTVRTPDQQDTQPGGEKKNKGWLRLLRFW